MKILLIHNKYLSRYIGGEDIVFQTELVALQEKLGKDNVFTYTVSNNDGNKLQILLTIWYSKKHYDAIYHMVKDHAIDIVHIHNFYPLLTPSVFKAAKDAGAIVVHTLHNYRWWCSSGILYRNNIGICERCVNSKFNLYGILNRCYRDSYSQSLVTAMAFYYYHLIDYQKYIDKFFVLTEFQKNKLKEFGLSYDKIIIKPNFVNSPDTINHGQKKDYIFVGRLDSSKGIDKLIEFWTNLDNKYILKIIGSGPLEDYVKNLHKNNILFLGKKSHEEVFESIANSKYLIQPSLLFETFGLTVIEAMSLGVPVIGFDIGTRKDFIKDGVNGFIANESNLKDIIIKSYDFEQYETLSQNAKNFANQFNKENIIAKQIEIYKRLINENISNNGCL